MKACDKSCSKPLGSKKKIFVSLQTDDDLRSTVLHKKSALERKVQCMLNVLAKVAMFVSKVHLSKWTGEVGVKLYLFSAPMGPEKLSLYVLIKTATFSETFTCPKTKKSLVPPCWDLREIILSLQIGNRGRGGLGHLLGHLQMAYLCGTVC